jgi:hypothetical protein
VEEGGEGQTFHGGPVKRIIAIKILDPFVIDFLDSRMDIEIAWPGRNLFEQI